MKLYARFREVVDALRRESPLTTAWFTSFTLSPYFVENYILPALLGDPHCPVRSIGFEALFHKILQNRIDVRFFYDHRAIDLSESKRTVVRFAAVDPQALQRKTGIPFGRGVFHPKIIFLQNESGKSWLFAGSANLTVAGWSRNREAALDREVRSTRNLQRIVEFFDAVAGERPADERALANKKGRDDWEFVHSTGGGSFLDRLLQDRPRSLYIWSPYFADDLCGLLEQRILPRMSAGAEIGLVPDIENEKIRVNESQRAFLKSLPSVRFFRDDPKSSKTDSPRMSHAKVWLSESHLAVGSWNLTESALHLSPQDGGCNVEAGIVMPVDTRMYEALRPKSRLDLGKVEFMTRDELDRDRQFLMSSLPFEIQVYRDWRYDRYEISVAGEEPTSLFRIRLPGVDGDRRLAVSELSQCVPISDIQRALKEHIFTVYNRDARPGDQPYRGMIIDLEADKRPVWRYSSLNDLLQDWAQDQAGIGSAAEYPDSYELAYVDAIDHQYNDEETGDSGGAARTDITFSYYTMFSAFENIRERLQSKSVDSAEALRIVVKTQPGSLFELCDKAHRAFSDPEVSPVYKWFLQEEINSLLKTAQARSRQLGEQVLGQAIDGKMLRAVADPSLFERYGQCESKWVACVRKIADYGKGK